jgi:antitoxin MazE
MYIHVAKSRRRSKMQVAQWGNSLAVRLPSAVVKALDLKPGDQIEIAVAGERAFEVTKSVENDALLARIRSMRGAMPRDFRFDRLESNSR